MKNNLFNTAAIMLLLFIAACESNDPSLNKLNVEFVAQSSLSRISAGGRIAEAGDTVIFKSFLMGVTELTLKGEKKGNGHGNCQDGDGDDESYDGKQNEDNEDGEQNDGNHQSAKWKVEGEFVVDLVAGTSTPDITDSLPAETAVYHKMEIELGPILPDGNSLFVQATITQGEETYEVEFATTKEFEIHLKRKKGIEIDQSMDKLMVALSVNKLFARIDWSKAKAGEDGIIRLQDPANALLGYQVKYNFFSMMKWGRDRNHNHRLDDHDED